MIITIVLKPQRGLSCVICPLIVTSFRPVHPQLRNILIRFHKPSFARSIDPFSYFCTTYLTKIISIQALCISTYYFRIRYQKNKPLFHLPRIQKTTFPLKFCTKTRLPPVSGKRYKKRKKKLGLQKNAYKDLRGCIIMSPALSEISLFFH